MTLLLKLNTLAPSADSVVSAYRSRLTHRPNVGAEVFVWLSEMNGGPGLTARGRVTDPLTATDRSHPQIGIVLTERLEHPVLGNAQIEFYREDTADHPIAIVSRNLYFYAHTQFAEISTSAAQFLRSYFRTAD